MTEQPITSRVILEKMLEAVRQFVVLAIPIWLGVFIGFATWPPGVGHPPPTLLSKAGWAIWITLYVVGVLLLASSHSDQFAEILHGGAAPEGGGER